MDQIYSEISNGKHLLCYGRIWNNRIFSFSIYFNTLAIINLSNGLISFSEIESDDLSNRIGKYQYATDKYGNVIALPHSSDSLIFMNEKLEIKSKIKISNGVRVNYNNIYEFGDGIYLLPVFRPDIAYYDYQKDSLEYISIPLAEFGIFNNDISVMCSFGKDGKIYLICVVPMILIVYDCNKKTFEKYSNDNGFMSIACADNKMVAGMQDGTIAVLSKNFDIVKKIKLPKEFVCNPIMPLSVCKRFENFIIFISYSANMIIRYNVLTEQIDNIDIPQEYISKDNMIHCMLLANSDKNLYLLMKDKMTVLIVNVIDNKVSILPIIYDEKTMDLVNRRIISNIENTMNLKEYIECIGGKSEQSASFSNNTCI